MIEKSGISPKSIKVNYMYNMAYEIFSLLTPLITTPYISRVLGAEGVGIYSYTYSIALFFVLLGNLGVMTYGQMVIAKCRGDRKETSRAFYELLILRSITLMISFVIYMGISLISVEHRPARIVLGIYVFAAAFDLTWLFRGIEDFSKVAIRNFIIKIAMIAMIFLFVKEADDVNLYIFFVAMSTFLGNGSFIFSAREILCSVPLRSLHVKQHIKPTLVFFIPTIATSVYTLLDKTMLGVLTYGTAANGYYEQAHKIEQMLIVVLTSLNMIMRSRMSSLYQQGRLDEMKMRLNRSISFISAVAISMTAGLVGIASNFVPLFLGGGFEESIVLLQLFAFLLVIIGLSNCLNTHFLGPSGRQGKNNYVLVAGAALNFLFNLMMIPKLGAVGAAIGSVLAETLILIGYLFLIRDFFKVRTLFSLVWKYVIAGIIMGTIVSYLGKLSGNVIMVLAIQVCAGVVIYVGIVLLLRDRFALNVVKAMLRKPLLP